MRLKLFPFYMSMLLGLGVMQVAVAPDAHASGSKAIAYVEGLAAKAVKVLESGASDAGKQSQLQSLFLKNVDVKWIGRFVLGKHWRGLDDAQKARYMKGYEGFIVKNYTSKFSDYSGQSYKVKNARKQPDGDYLVTMALESSTGGADILTDYRLRPASGSFKVVDIIVEGVSLITTQRSEFGSVVSRKGAEALIVALEKKAAA